MRARDEGRPRQRVDHDCPDGLVVAALVAVNAVGDVIDPATGRIVAGARTDDGTRPRGRLRAIAANGTRAAAAAAGREHDARRGRDQRQADQGAGDEGGADGARRLRARDLPVAHWLDGDTIFALATGTTGAAANVDLLGALAADAVADAILRAVRAARSIPGYPAASDMR